MCKCCSSREKGIFLPDNNQGHIHTTKVKGLLMIKWTFHILLTPQCNPCNCSSYRHCLMRGFPPLRRKLFCFIVRNSVGYERERMDSRFQIPGLLTKYPDVVGRCKVNQSSFIFHRRPQPWHRLLVSERVGLSGSSRLFFYSEIQGRVPVFLVFVFLRSSFRIC